MPTTASTSAAPTASTSAAPTGAPDAPDDIWGVNRPPALPGPGAGPHPGATTGPTGLDRGLEVLRRAPLRRDPARGLLGGVAAGVARTLDVSPAAVRVTAALLTLFFGLGIGLYLVAWAVLPDDDGRTHVEQAVRGGRPASLTVVGLAGLPVLGVVAGVLGAGWPLLLVMAVVALVVATRKGHLLPHAHG